jgi:hypothetical protein
MDNINLIVIGRIHMLQLSALGTKVIKLASGLTLVASLAACFGGGDAPVRKIATENLTVAIDKTTGPSLVASALGHTYRFSKGIPDLGINVATTLTLSGSAAAPTFTITSAQGTLTGTMTYGSCNFEGYAIILCGLSIGVASALTSELPQTLPQQLFFGAPDQPNWAVSSPESFTGFLYPDGRVGFGPFIYGTVNVVVPTGATGGG